MSSPRSTEQSSHNKEIFEMRTFVNDSPGLKKSESDTRMRAVMDLIYQKVRIEWGEGENAGTLGQWEWWVIVITKASESRAPDYTTRCWSAIRGFVGTVGRRSIGAPHVNSHFAVNEDFGFASSGPKGGWASVC